jgi:ribosomal protein L7/L12
MAELIESIADLKRDLERLERKVDYLFRQIDATYVESDLPSFMLEATQYIKHGRREEAMKVIREYTAVGLYEAKAQVEQIERNLGMTQPVFTHDLSQRS